MNDNSEHSSLVFTSGDEDTFSSEDDEITKTIAIRDKIKQYIDQHQKAPVRPPKTQSLDFYLLEACKYILFIHLHDGPPEPPNIDDSDDILKQKVIYKCVKKNYTKLISMFQVYQRIIIDGVFNDIEEQTSGVDHPIKDILDIIIVHQELHCRRMKTSPSKQRTKMGVGETRDIIYDPVTCTPCRFEESKDPSRDTNPTSMKYYRAPSSMKWFIFNPLPSDFDSDVIDPMEGDQNHRIALDADKLQNTLDPRYQVRDPFGVVLPEKWGKLLGIIHNIVHFESYMKSYLLTAVVMDNSKTFEQNWKDLTGNYYGKTITKYARKVKGTPLVVRKITEMRDFLRFVIEFSELFIK